MLGLHCETLLKEMEDKTDLEEIHSERNGNILHDRYRGKNKHLKNLKIYPGLHTSQ